MIGLACLVTVSAVGFTNLSARTSDRTSDVGTKVVAVGDIASCESDGDEATAKLIEELAPSALFALGDLAYEDGSEEQFEDCYDPSYGRFKDITYPAIGNHDYGEDGYEGYADDPSRTYDTSGYSGYFGARAGEAGKFWYSYDLGSWHVVVLNSNCDNGVGCDPYSEQMTWLDDDLSKTDKPCILGYWHHPLFTSGYHGDDPKMRAAWNLLYGYGADVVLNGHEHDYERFASQDPYGNPDPNGIREFIVGTGGKSLRRPATAKANSEALSNTSYGVLELTLHESSYEWAFKPATGGFTDSGEQECH